MAATIFRCRTCRRHRRSNDRRAIDAATLAHPEFHILLVAGDATRHVYTNAVLQMRDSLTGVGLGIDRVRTMSADQQTVGADVYEREVVTRSQREAGDKTVALPGAIEPPTLALTASRVLDLNAAAPGQACFAYLVSTPKDGGLKLADTKGLTPEILTAR